MSEAKRKHGSKANWSKGELRRLRKLMKKRQPEFGTGPRAQQKWIAELNKIVRAGPDERKKIRENLGWLLA